MTGRGGHITIGGKTVAVTGWSMTRARPRPTDLDLLLAAVLAEPEEDTPRLAFADALDERGGPGDAERAEFVRVQCQIAALEEDGHDGPPDDGHTCCEDPCPVCGAVERHRGLVARSLELSGVQVPHPHGGHSSLELVMRGPVRLVEMPGLVDYGFRRGFIEWVTCTAEDWLAAGDSILAAHPVRRVSLADDPRFSPAWGIDWLTTSRVGNVWTVAKWPGVEFTLPPPVEVGPDGGFLLPAEITPAMMTMLNEPLRLTPSALPGYVNLTPELLADAGGQNCAAAWGDAQASAARVFGAPPAEPDPAAAPDLCERCGRETGSRHFDGTRGPRDGWRLCDDCHATATMEE